MNEPGSGSNGQGGKPRVPAQGSPGHEVNGPSDIPAAQTNDTLADTEPEELLIDDHTWRRMLRRAFGTSGCPDEP